MRRRAKIQLDPDMIAEFCERHHIKKLSLFGSVLTDRFGPESDIDMLVEFEPEARVSLFDVGGMVYELTEKLGRQVDIRTPAGLSPYFRDEVIAQAELLYAA
ncbi:MAG: nucleotidyltransferase [Phycisphaera sp.]|nr:nucleotidyltransferase [Phycisphaera sp.]